MFHGTLKGGFMAWPESMGGPFLTAVPSARKDARRIRVHYGLDCRHPSPRTTYRHPLTPTAMAVPRIRTPRSRRPNKPYIDLRQFYATDRMLIDPENAGEGKVTRR